MHPLAGCLAKIARARWHLGAVRESVRTFITEAPYYVHGEVNEAAQEAVFTARANPNFAPPPSVSIGITLICGEIAHQLRSALDHLVWQLVISNGQAPGRKHGFPVFKDEALYNQKSPAMIAGVSDEAAVRIRAAQPYHAGNDAERTLTWIVQELNNTEKHRMIPLTTTYSCVGQAVMHRPDGTTLEILPWQEEVRAPLHDRMEIARVRLVDVVHNARFEIPVVLDIAFEQLAALDVRPATYLLQEATDYVENLINSFQGEFR